MPEGNSQSAARRQTSRRLVCGAWDGAVNSQARQALVAPTRATVDKTRKMEIKKLKRGRPSAGARVWGYLFRSLPNRLRDSFASLIANLGRLKTKRQKKLELASVVAVES